MELNSYKVWANTRANHLKGTLTKTVILNKYLLYKDCRIQRLGIKILYQSIWLLWYCELFSFYQSLRAIIIIWIRNRISKLHTCKTRQKIGIILNILNVYVEFVNFSIKRRNVIIISKFDKSWICIELLFL